MSVRRVHSPERSSSCLPFARFFRSSKKSSTGYITLPTEVKYHDEPQFQKFDRFMSDYTDLDIDHDSDYDVEGVDSDDESTLAGFSDEKMFAKFDSSSRLRKLRELMLKHSIGVYIIPSEDEHQSEYTATKDHRRQYISGFTGSAGIAVVTLTDPVKLTGKAALSTDGRYYLQAEQQLDENWTLLKLTVPSYPTWQQWAINQSAQNSYSKKISIDPKLINNKSAQWLLSESEVKGLKFEPIFQNLIDIIWDSTGERPFFKSSMVYELDIKFSGISTNDKVEQVRKVLKEEKVDSLIVAALDDIAWLFNLRGDDVSFNPVFFSYAIVSLEKVFLYIDDNKIDDKTSAYLKTIDNLTIKSYEEFWNDVGEFKNLMGPANPSLLLMNELSPKISRSLISEMKSIKNEAEIAGARSLQFKDGIALARYFSWLEYLLVVKGELITEWVLLERCEYYRSKLPYYKSLSFDTISSTGANGAIIHYAPTADKSDVIDPYKVYLCDSGAQYLDGTTDITRTFHFTKPTKEQIRNYTLVLKGHLLLTMEVFLEGTTGSQLDILCRTPLWKWGLNYNHGTGHGIGSFLCVHEPPIYIGSNIEIKPGCFISDEPGFYKDGEYGLRVESDILCVKSDEEPFNEKLFLKFEYLTKVPFCHNLIDKKMLTEDEIKWINKYNYNLREELIPILESEFNDVRAIRWLLRETQPL